MLNLNSDARDRFEWAVNQQIINPDQECVEDIVYIVSNQEIVSYCTSNGCVSFDVDDLEFIE